MLCPHRDVLQTQDWSRDGDADSPNENITDSTERYSIYKEKCFIHNSHQTPASQTVPPAGMLTRRDTKHNSESASVWIPHQPTSAFTYKATYDTEKSRQSNGLGGLHGPRGGLWPMPDSTSVQVSGICSDVRFWYSFCWCGVILFWAKRHSPEWKSDVNSRSWSDSYLLPDSQEQLIQPFRGILPNPSFWYSFALSLIRAVMSLWW